MSAILLAGAVCILRRRRPAPLGSCRNCKYPLSELQVQCCPECGAAVGGDATKQRLRIVRIAVALLCTLVGLYAAYSGWRCNRRGGRCQDMIPTVVLAATVRYCPSLTWHVLYSRIMWHAEGRERIPRWQRQLLLDSCVMILDDQYRTMAVPLDMLSNYRAAIYLIVSFPDEAMPSLPRLRQLASHDVVEVRRDAVWALGQLKDQSQETERALNEAMMDEDRLVKEYAVDALRELQLPVRSPE